MSDTNRTDVAGKVLGDFQAIGDAARQTGEQARQAGANAIDQARDVAYAAKERAASVMDTLGEQAGSGAESQKANLADRLEDVAKAVHRSGEQLEGHQDWVAHLVERGAAELSTLATTLRSNDLQNLLGDLGSLARRQPALFVGASMAAGFALTRVGRLAVSGTAPSGRTPPAAPHLGTAQTEAGLPSGPHPPADTAPAATIPASDPLGTSEVAHERD